MNITFEAKGLTELQAQMDKLATANEVQDVNKRIFQRAVDITEPRMKSRMPRSGNNAASGRRGYRPPGHAADNIPKKVTKKKGSVGWELNGDAENWFYMKFVEWGTSKMPPRDFIDNTKAESETEYFRIAEDEYQKFINQKLGV